jgi:hypothetical protein
VLDAELPGATRQLRSMGCHVVEEAIIFFRREMGDQSAHELMQQCCDLITSGFWSGQHGMDLLHFVPQSVMLLHYSIENVGLSFRAGHGSAPDDKLESFQRSVMNGIRLFPLSLLEAWQTSCRPKCSIQHMEFGRNYLTKVFASAMIRQS